MQRKMASFASDLNALNARSRWFDGGLMLNGRLDRIERAMPIDVMLDLVSARLNASFARISGIAQVAMRRCAFHHRQGVADAPDAERFLREVGERAVIREEPQDQTLRAIRGASETWIAWVIAHERSDPTCVDCRKLMPLDEHIV